MRNLPPPSGCAPSTCPYDSPTGLNLLECINLNERKKQTISLVRSKNKNWKQNQINKDKQSVYKILLIADFFNVFLEMPMTATVIIPMTQ